MQSFVGSYGPMVHPVAACATAAVSLEEAHDKIRAGKALAILAGGFDDLTPEGLQGFGDMGATASSDDLEAMGIAPHESSRANDVRRRGFVEAQGGGALLVVRGDVALALGLPVRGVLAYAGSFADGVQASIPASGMGVLAAARGGADSPLARALARLGLTADDIAVVSKHDTSTEMNDPNEADLHERIQAALGRTPGNPLLVVSQKTVTGHAKGGAAAWQVDGMLRMMQTGVVPGNRNLESADPLLRDGAFLTLGDRADRARAAGADPRRPRHEPRLRARLGAAGDRAPRHVPRGGPGGAARGRTCSAPAGAARRASSSACARASAAPPPCAAPTGGSGTDDPAAAREAEAALLTDPVGAPAQRRRVRPAGAARAVTTLAVGLDIVTTTTFAEQLADSASAFVDATFTAGEQRAARAPEADPRAAPGRPLRRQGGVRQGLVGRARRPRAGAGTIDLREIEVVDDGHGRPALRLHGAVAAAVEHLAAELGVAAPLRTHLSLSHDPPTAAAVVLLSAP